MFKKYPYDQTKNQLETNGIFLLLILQLQIILDFRGTLASSIPFVEVTYNGPTEGAFSITNEQIILSQVGEGVVW